MWVHRARGHQRGHGNTPGRPSTAGTEGRLTFQAGSALPSALLHQQLLGAVQLLLHHREARAELQGLAEGWAEGGCRGEESLDLGPEAGVQPQHQDELEGRHYGRVRGDAPHVVAGLAVLHAEVEEGSSQPARLAAGQAQQLAPQLGGELGRHQEA